MDAAEFLKRRDYFRLGDLVTERPNPNTSGLSDWAKSDLNRALRVLREVDLAALRVTAARRSELAPVFSAIAEALADGDRIFLAGCGATGRLSLSLEHIWRRARPGSDRLVSFMAGGDVALVHSLEGFEDFPEYGARHLRELGFGERDLLVGSSEGGETPFVLGAVQEAAKLSRRRPIFLHCNPAELLTERVERSRVVLGDPRIDSHSLLVGPMALTGSTRMQASTVLMLVIGLALDFGHNIEGAFGALSEWIHFLESAPVSNLRPFVQLEAQTYLEGHHALYSADDLAITVFTDTTERAPTFNLPPFDNPAHPTPQHSLAYLMIPSADNGAEGWHRLLARDPRPLDWPEIHAKATSEYLRTFDFSRKARAFRQAILPESEHFDFHIEARGDCLNFQFRGLDEDFALPDLGDLLTHLTLKMILNMHSTLVLGRLGRFEGNLMTWVCPSNGKLIDRAARYTQILLERQGMGHYSYEEIVKAQFQARAGLTAGESVVHKTIQVLTGQISGRTPPPVFPGPPSP